jgi:dihydroorotase
VTYDLLITNGHVLDPGTGLDGKMDIAISGGRIAAVEPHIDPATASQVLEIRGADRYVVPGLIDIHTHVAHGATTAGVGMGCCDPDAIGVRSGVTTLVDCGSVGVANLGVFPTHILPKARTRVSVYVNVGSYAHTMPGPADVYRLDDINPGAISACAEHNPGLISGVKLRLVGGIVDELGEEMVTRSKTVARELGVPLMTHIGDFFGGRASRAERLAEVTQFLIKTLEPGDILTHLCTPNLGGVMDRLTESLANLREARDRGVTLDPAVGMGNFGYDVAREQAERGMFPDTISSDLTAGGQSFHSLVECMAKFMAVGYSFEDVVKMTTVNAAKAIGQADELGALAVGREADITVLDLVRGDFTFRDTTKKWFRGEHGIVPVHTLKSGELVPPHWGPHPWGWLPATAETP